MEEINRVKTVVVTGGSRGIGKATAIKFAEAGFNVVIIYEKEKVQAENVVKTIQKMGLQAVSYQCDISDARQVKGTFKDIYQQFNFIDVLVNNAGIADVNLFTDISEEQWNRLFDVNVKGVFHCIQAVLPSMISEKKGNIVNVASVWGVVGASMEVHYSATKGAIIAMTKALAQEEAPSNIRVNAVAPGAILTDMIKPLGKETLKDFAMEIPQQRIGKPEEVAETIVFLGTDKSSYITGQVIGVNGGVVV